MLPVIAKYGTCLVLFFALAAPADGLAAGGRTTQAAKRARTAVTKPSPKKKAPAKARKSRPKRAARARPQTTLDIDSCVADRFSADQAALRRQIERWMDVRYKRGGITMKGVDCSGFLVQVYGDAADLRLPRTSREQAAVGARISGEDLDFGDLVFFRTRLKSKRISHVGIYIGEDRFVHASRHRGVSVDRLSSSYYSKRFVMARRILPAPETALID